MNITKISIKNEKISIKYEDGFDVLSVVSEEKAKETFYTAFAKLKDVFDEIAELPSSYDKIFVTEITIGYDFSLLDEVSVCGEMALAKTNGALNIQTPPKKYHDTTIEIGDKTIIKAGLSKANQEAITDLIEEACDFVNGERAQANLFPKEDLKKSKGRKGKKQNNDSVEMPE